MGPPAGHRGGIRTSRGRDRRRTRLLTTDRLPAPARPFSPTEHCHQTHAASLFYDGAVLVGDGWHHETPVRARQTHGRTSVHQRSKPGTNGFRKDGSDGVCRAEGTDDRRQSARATNQTAEGVKSCRAIVHLARKHGVEMPITEVVTAVIGGTATVKDAAAALMSRSPKPELYDA
ncbi:hypothetical protein GFH48_06205 [Streptomyces fagopyri]|uniref:Glycerol-3-phosphate dehydrogenase NAD-dependent C-terminal domain-containing protein n=1 Tax=Streptomyces fagopyri TaxID=2662397 RepID=A0A5Q0L7Z7_9ACTN|nr:hypothetical protein [Streptomyces fagopyri]QFZ72914.1 hypothetical protein GFH48_06205 [Streptomyces fagopyri]